VRAVSSVGRADDS